MKPFNPLGKGLEALIPRKPDIEMSLEITEIHIHQIQPNPFQPRLYFDAEELNQLKESIERHGLNQPIVVRKTSKGYELIAGERRLRACTLADKETIPCVIKNVSDEESLQLAIIENLDRSNLNPIETALGYQRLIDEFGMETTEVASLFSRNRTTIANTLRLLTLPEEVQQLLMAGELTEGHARAILGCETEAKMITLSDAVVKDKLSVRETESKAKGEKETTKVYNTALKAIAKDLKKLLRLKAKIAVKQKKKGFALELTFKTVEELTEFKDQLK